jgi:hypothetical protein
VELTEDRAAAPGAPAPAARVAAIVAVGAAVVALVLAVLSVTILGGGGAGEVVDGVIEATLSGSGDRVQLVAGDRVPDAATLRTADGPAAIRVGDGDLSLEDGSTLVVDGDELALERGHLLVSSRDAIRVEVATVVVQGRGVWRADLGATSRIGTYRGRVQADDGPRTRQLARFEQVDLQGGSLAGAAVPLRYSDQDRWDGQHLADALATDRLARQLETSLEAEHGPAPRPAAFFSSFAGADEAVLARLEDLAPRRQAEHVGPPATVLLGIAVADALVADGGFLPATAVGRVIELRRGGARWGLVLLTHDLGPSSLRAAAERALERAAEDPPPAALTAPAPGPGQTDARLARGRPTADRRRRWTVGHLPILRRARPRRPRRRLRLLLPRRLPRPLRLPRGEERWTRSRTSSARGARPSPTCWRGRPARRSAWSAWWGNCCRGPEVCPGELTSRSATPSGWPGRRGVDSLSRHLRSGPRAGRCSSRPTSDLSR